MIRTRPCATPEDAFRRRQGLLAVLLNHGPWALKQYFEEMAAAYFVSLSESLGVWSLFRKPETRGERCEK